MKKEYFLKDYSILQRKFIAGGLAATFAFGTVGSGLAGAMNEDSFESSFESSLELINEGDVEKSDSEKNLELLEKWNQLILTSNEFKEKKEELMSYIPDTAGGILKIILGKEDIDPDDCDEYILTADKKIDEKIKESILEKFLQKKAGVINKKNKVKFEEGHRKSYFSYLTEKGVKAWIREYFLRCEEFSQIIKKKDEKDDSEKLNSKVIIKENKDVKVKKNKVNKKVLIKAIVSIFIIAVIAVIVFIIIYFATRSSGSAKIDEGSSSKKEGQNGQGIPTDTKQPESREEKGRRGTEAANQGSVSSNLVKWGVLATGGLLATSLVAAEDIYSENSENSGVLNSVENKTETKKEPSEFDLKLGSKGSNTEDTEETDKKTDDSKNNK